MDAVFEQHAPHAEHERLSGLDVELVVIAVFAPIDGSADGRRNAELAALFRANCCRPRSRRRPDPGRRPIVRRCSRRAPSRRESRARRASRRRRRESERSATQRPIAVAGEWHGLWPTSCGRRFLDRQRLCGPWSISSTVLVAARRRCGWQAAATLLSGRIGFFRESRRSSRRSLPSRVAWLAAVAGRRL